MLLKRKAKTEEESLARVEPAPDADGNHLKSLAELRDEIGRLAADTGDRGLETELRLRRLRQVAGLRLIGEAPANPSYVEAAESAPARQDGLPSLDPSELNAAGLRAAVLESGCLLVRGLLDGDRALEFADEIDRAFRAREEADTGSEGRRYYDEIEPDPPLEVGDRSWIAAGGGVLAADSPRLLEEMVAAFARVRLAEVIAEYLGETPAVSIQKCTLRKASPDTSGAWHQDGRFLSEVRAMNVWVALSRCGDTAPGLDLVPRRLDDFVETGTEGTLLPTQVSDAVAEEAAGEEGVLRPIFEPGDALLFDEMFLHSTASEPSMPNPRYAIESWFFGPSRFPWGYVPLAI